MISIGETFQKVEPRYIALVIIIFWILFALYYLRCFSFVFPSCVPYSSSFSSCTFGKQTNLYSFWVTISKSTKRNRKSFNSIHYSHYFVIPFSLARLESCNRRRFIIHCIFLSISSYIRSLFTHRTTNNCLLPHVLHPSLLIFHGIHHFRCSYSMEGRERIFKRQEKKVIPKRPSHVWQTIWNIFTPPLELFIITLFFY